jgi:hypothetical protein
LKNRVCKYLPGARMAKPPAIIIPPIYNLIIADLCVFTSPLLIANQALGTAYIVRMLRRWSAPK